jgi:hypothetical protein
MGYERADPKLSMDIEKSEVETYITLNEKRAEKGQEAIDFTMIKNPADLPMNPQAIQAWQNMQRGGSPFGDTGDMYGEDDEGGGDFGEEEGEAGDGNGDFGEDDSGNGWGDMQEQAGDMGKSLNRRGVVRIVV